MSVPNKESTHETPKQVKARQKAGQTPGQTQKNIDAYMKSPGMKTPVKSMKSPGIKTPLKSISADNTTSLIVSSVTTESSESDGTMARHTEAIMQRLKSFEDAQKDLVKKLENLPTKAYIDEKFKEVATKDSVKNQLDKLKDDLKIQINEEVEKIRGEIHDLDINFHKCLTECQKLENKIETQEQNINSVRLENRQLKERCVNLENYSRRNNVRIFGVEDANKAESVAETVEWVLGICNETLKVNVTDNDIDIAHRMGAFQTNGIRPIIVKFLSRRCKNAVIKARRILARSGIVITEDVAKEVYDLQKEVYKHEDVTNSWTNEGVVFALLTNKSVVKVRNNEDLKDLKSLKPLKK